MNLCADENKKSFFEPDCGSPYRNFEEKKEKRTG
jgi:hypothetical protein